jgi:DNA-directed RNA polymerase specialized sigma24 family protein
MRRRNNPTVVDLVQEFQATFQKVAAMPPNERATTAHQMWAQLLTLQGQCAKLRTSAVRELRGDGATQRAIADLLDVSVTRVRQIEDAEPATRRKEGGSAAAAGK